jgi:aspartyl-tRNA(Asn)/glutamyl-tRNA(Gln) amidotransferase subunit A
MELCELTLTELSTRLRAGEVSSVEVTEAFLARVREVEEKVKAFLHVDGEGALTAARESDARRAAGHPLSTLDGVPVALKDVLVTRGVPTTAGSKVLQGFVPPYDGTVVRKLREAGLVSLGKTNLDEFAMGSSTENSGYFPTRNPFDLSRSPGGSSGGSAAAVAAREAPAALGTDTGGSIRQPAALTNLVGLKPTYGRVSRFGVVAFASSLDQVGPMARTVADTAALLQVIAGHDERDATSAVLPVPELSADLEAGVKGLRLGLPREYFVPGMDPEVEAAVRAAAAEYERLGAKVVEVSLPHTKHALATYYLIAPAEASANLARYDGVRFGHRAKGADGLKAVYTQSREQGFGAEVKRRIMLGTYALSSGYYDAYYLKAQKVRTLIREDFTRAFDEVDAILSPTSPVPAFKLGEKTANPLAMYLLDVLTLPCNLAGLPGLSLSCGFTKSGLPIGLQLLGRPFDEARLLRIARAYEREHDFFRARPALEARA